MAIIVNQSNSEIYFGNLKVATAAVFPGMGVTPDFSAGTCAKLADNEVAGACVVCNYDPYADYNKTDSDEYSVAVGKYARLKKLLVGDVISTDQYTGSLSVDDIVMIGDANDTGHEGEWIATGGTPIVTGVVIETGVDVFGATGVKIQILTA